MKHIIAAAATALTLLSAAPALAHTTGQPGVHLTGGSLGVRSFEAWVRLPGDKDVKPAWACSEHPRFPADTVIRIKNSAGYIVNRRGWCLADARDGSYTWWDWNGRNAQGKAVKPGKYRIQSIARWRECEPDTTDCQLVIHRSETLVRIKKEVRRYRYVNTVKRGVETANRSCIRQEQYGNCSFTRMTGRGLYYVGTYAKARGTYQLRIPRRSEFRSKWVEYDVHLEGECSKTSAKWTRRGRRFKAVITTNGFNGQGYCEVQRVVVRTRKSYIDYVWERA